MRLFERARYLLRISNSYSLLRRYFVVNGFDGALTMLGLIMGFLMSSGTDLNVVINACMGAAIALGVSGVSSAYISEVAERKYVLEKLQQAMISELENSAHVEAAKWVPWMVALVNGFAPFCISLLIVMPLWLSSMGIPLPLPPLYSAVVMAFSLVFLLGVYLGRIADISWFRSGIQTLLTAIVTMTFIYFLVS